MINLQIERLKIRPGDRLVVHADVDMEDLGAGQAAEIRERVKIALALDWDIPVAIVTRGWSITVEDA